VSAVRALPTPEVVWNAEFKLTELGQSALRSEVDFVKLTVSICG